MGKEQTTKNQKKEFLEWGNVENAKNIACIFGCACEPEAIQKISVNSRNYRIMRCPEDGLMFLSPQPNNQSLQNIYKESYFSWLYSQEKVSVNGDHRHEDALVRVGELNKYQPCRGNFLEVGCGYGHVVEEARAQGWKAVGIEYSHFASKMAKKMSTR